MSEASRSACDILKPSVTKKGAGLTDTAHSLANNF